MNESLVSCSCGYTSCGVMQSFEYNSTHNCMYILLHSIVIFNDILYKNQSHVLDIFVFRIFSNFPGRQNEKATLYFTTVLKMISPTIILKTP